MRGRETENPHSNVEEKGEQLRVLNYASVDLILVTREAAQDAQRPFKLLYSMTQQGIGVCHIAPGTEEKEPVNQSIDLQGMCLGPQDDKSSTNKLL